MKKHTSNYHLSRDYSARQALFKTLIRSLILKEKIETTATKASATKPIFEKLLTKARLGTVAKIRQIHAFLGNNDLVHKLVHEIAPRYKDVKGGYTKVVAYGNRRGDNAPIVIWSLTKQKEVKPKLAETSKSQNTEQKSEVKEAKIVKTKTPKTTSPRKQTVKTASVKLAPSRAGKRGDK